MKKILLLLFSIVTLHSAAQLTCEIEVFDTVVCAGQSFTVFTGNSTDHLFRFTPEGELSTLPFVELETWSPMTVYLDIYTREDTSFVCSDSVNLTVHPMMVVTMEQLNTGCPYECKSQVKASVEGGYPPYSYEWSADVAPNDSSTALGLCSDSEYSLLVYDTVCIYDTTFLVESFDIHEIEITSDPEDSVFTVNPRVTFYYENKSADSIPLTNFFWDFGDGTTSTETFPTHTFSESDTVKFAYTTIDNCDSVEYIIIQVRELEIEVPNVFTPNGDGVNDTFEVPNLDKYVTNEVVIVNRWGEKVYEANGYNNDWDGGSQPDGTYFYIIRAAGIFKEDVFRGAVTIIGSGN